MINSYHTLMDDRTGRSAWRDCASLPAGTRLGQLPFQGPGTINSILSSRNAKKEMVELDGETSNALFDVLEDWNTSLEAEEFRHHPLLRGPRP